MLYKEQASLDLSGYQRNHIILKDLSFIFFVITIFNYLLLKLCFSTRIILKYFKIPPMPIQIINKHFTQKLLIQLLIIISSLYGKCPNTKFFLVLIFPYSDWIRRFTPCSVDNDRNRICMTRYNLLVAYHASNTKRGGVYIYFKHLLSAIKINELRWLKECLFTE